MMRIMRKRTIIMMRRNHKVLLVIEKAEKS